LIDKFHAKRLKVAQAVDEIPTYILELEKRAKLSVPLLKHISTAICVNYPHNC